MKERLKMSFIGSWLFTLISSVGLLFSGFLWHFVFEPVADTDLTLLVCYGVGQALIFFIVLFGLVRWDNRDKA